MNDVTGVVQRSTSSTAVGSSDGSAAQPVELLRVLGQGDERAGDGVAGGLVAGDEQLDEEHAELVVGERLAVLLVGGEHRHDVVARLRPAAPRPGRAARRSSRRAARMRSSSDQSVAPGMAASDQRNSRSSSPAGRPSSWAISWIGSGTASSAVTSTTAPSAAFAASASRAAPVRSRTSTSSSRTTALVNPGRASFR